MQCVIVFFGGGNWMHVGGAPYLAMLAYKIL